MKNPDNGDPSQQALRLAQLEIKMLREQLLKAIDEAQATRDQMQKLAATVTAKPAAASATPPLPASAPPNESAGPAPISTNGKHRVLCIEDSRENFELLQTILLDRPGTHLTWAESGRKGLELASETPPQLVLLDLDLPDMHGSEVLGLLRAQPATALIPVIVISADATPSQIERMLTAGASDYLTKPFEIRRFLLMFDEVFPKKKAEPASNEATSSNHDTTAAE